MPIDKYYGGHGKKVMREMMEQYGAKKGKEVFYAMMAKQEKKKKKKKW